MGRRILRLCVKNFRTCIGLARWLVGPGRMRHGWPNELRSAQPIGLISNRLGRLLFSNGKVGLFGVGLAVRGLIVVA